MVTTDKEDVACREEELHIAKDHTSPAAQLESRDSENTNVPELRPDLGHICLHRLSKTAVVVALRRGFYYWGAVKDGPKTGSKMVYLDFPRPQGHFFGSVPVSPWAGSGV